MAAMINVHVEALDEGGYVVTSEDVQGLGAQGGKESGLVNELFRLLRTNDVPHVLLENVSFILALGKGHAMRHIAASLEELEYRWAYRIVDTRAFGLPQRRQRLFLVASRVFEPSDVVMRGNLPDGTSAPIG